MNASEAMACVRLRTLVYCSIAATHKPGFGHGDLFTSKFGVGVVDLVKFELDCIHAHM